MVAATLAGLCEPGGRVSPVTGNAPAAGTAARLWYPARAVRVPTRGIIELSEQGSEVTEAFVDSILENLPIMVFVKDAKELRFVRFNRAGEELLGYRREELIGKNDYDFFPKSEADFFTGRDREVLANGVVIDIPEEPIHTRHGVRYLHTKKVPILDERGAPRYLLGISEDITEQKMAAEALLKAHENLEGKVRERTAELSRLNAALESEIRERRSVEAALAHHAAELSRSNRELEQYAYVASHDLQEPLRMVTSYVELLQERYQGRLDDAAQDFIGYALDGAQRMKRLIDDLLAYSRVATRRQEPQPTDSAAALADALDNLRLAVEESNATVTHDALPTVLAVDTQLRQLFQNLVGNALKFRREDPPRVHVAATSGADAWTFSIADNGVGIERRFHDEVFMIFRRLHGREYAGTGIGLAVCKKIVEQHGGRIWLESEPGRGTTFHFTLPK
jgi:PAS domain S-box-containing protein